MFNINLDTPDGDFLSLEKLKENSISFGFGQISDYIQGNTGTVNFTGNILYRGQHFNKVFNYYGQTVLYMQKYQNGNNDTIMKNKFLLGLFVCKQDNFHFTKLEKINELQINNINASSFSSIMKMKKLLRNGTVVELGSAKKTNKNDATPFILHGDFVMNKGDVLLCEHIFDIVLSGSGGTPTYSVRGDYTLYL